MLPSLSKLSLNQTHPVPETDARTAADKRKRDEEAPVEYWPLRKTNIVNPVCVAESDEEAVKCIPLSEYDATEGWYHEYQLDIELLKNELRISEDNPKRPPSDPNTKTIQLQMARETMDMVKPLSTSTRQREVQARQKIRFMDMGIKEFVSLDVKLSAICNDYSYWAMPQNPTQRQYEPVEKLSNCCGVICSSIYLKELQNDPDLKQKLESGYIGHNDGGLTVNGSVTKSVMDRMKKDENAEIMGGFNSGQAVNSLDYEWMQKNNFFKSLNKNGLDFESLMAQHTGLWFRTNMKRATMEKDILRNRVEAYYTLTAALQSVGMPVYALMTEGGECLSSLNEKAMGDLTSEMRNYMDFNERKSSDMMINFDAYLGRRFSACMLQLSEVGYCLSDSKPSNFLFQRSYKPLSLPEIHERSFPACVVATDIDPQFSLLVDIAVPERSPEMDKGKGIPSAKEDGYMAGPECIRFANLSVFAIMAGCYHYYDITQHTYGRKIMEAALVPMKRYAGLHVKDGSGSWGGALFCKHFFSPVAADTGLGFRFIGSHGFKENSIQLFDERAKAWTQYDWTNFWSMFALQFVSMTISYGLKHIPPGEHSPCAGLFRELHNMKYSELITELTGKKLKDWVPPFGVLVVLLVQWFVTKRDEIKTPSSPKGDA